MNPSCPVCLDEMVPRERQAAIVAAAGAYVDAREAAEADDTTKNTVAEQVAWCDLQKAVRG